MESVSLSRIVRTTVMVLIVAGSVSVSAQMVNQVLPYSGSTTNLCNGEIVNFSGTIHLHEKTQVSSDGRIHYVSNNNFSVSGTGQTTWATYSMNGTLHSNAKYPSYPITFRQRNRFISNSSAAPSFHLTVAYHVNGNGVQTSVTHEADCR